MHHVPVKFVKSRQRYEGECSHPECSFSLSARTQKEAQRHRVFHEDSKNRG